MENKNEQNNVKSRKTRVSQNSFPLFGIEEAVRIPKAIKDNYAGQATSPLLVAAACGISPTSSNWRYLTGAAVAYGLTEGGYNAQEISLTPLGERVVSPLVEGDDKKALAEAALVPTILAKLYNQYNGNKLPKQEILKNVLQREGVPVDRLDDAVKIFKDNANFVGFLRIISGNEFILLEAQQQTTHSQNTIAEPQIKEDSVIEESESVPAELLEKLNVTPPTKENTSISKPSHEKKPHVFISHGKNNKIIIEQLKELITYGQMQPIVSIERETTAIPVPDKVFDDMRDCDAGIIHVDTEEMVNENGTSFNCLNENVLIEIGAAIALYGKRVILLCKKGTKLPSNLQGLYRCEYEGNQLDYAATMKILKTLQELRNLF